MVPPVTVFTSTSLGFVKALHFSVRSGSICITSLLNQVDVPRFAGGSYPAVVTPGISVNGPKAETVDLCHWNRIVAPAGVPPATVIGIGSPSNPIHTNSLACAIAPATKAVETVISIRLLLLGVDNEAFPAASGGLHKTPSKSITGTL